MESKPGFSIIEVVTGFAIIGLVSILVATLYFAHSKIITDQNTGIEIASQNKLALDDMTNQIRESESIVSTCSGCGGDTTSASVLVLRLWPIDTSGEPQDPGADSYDYIVFKRDATDNTRLIKKTVPNAASARLSASKVLATQISNLQFNYDDADPTQASEVTISVSTTATSYGKTQTIDQSSKAILRNK